MLVKPLVRPIVRAIAGNPTASLGSGFSPTSLFLDGSKGVVYDNNDLSSFYLDSAGTTAATVNGLVGLQLDKSQGGATPRRNLITYSEQFDNAAWAKANATVTANAANNHLGEATADKLIPDAVATQHRIDSANAAVLNSTQYTVSCYAKADGYGFLVLRLRDAVSTADAIFNLSTGAVGTINISSWSAGSSSMESLGGGWYRCSFTATSNVAGATAGTSICRINVGNPSSNGDVSAWAGNGTDGILIWGAQVEIGSAASTYQVIVAGANGDWTPGNHRYQSTTGSKPVLRGTPTGANLVTNGDFASGTGWSIIDTAPGSTTISGGTATMNNGTTGTSRLRQSFASTAGSYLITFTVSGYSGTALSKLDIGNTSGGDTTYGSIVVNANGSYTRYVDNVTSGTLGLAFIVAAGTATSMTLDNVSVLNVSAGSVTAPYGLQYDGVDDFMQTAAVDFTATDKMFVCAGVRKLSDAATGTVACLGDLGATNGTFEFRAPWNAATANIGFGMRGNAGATSGATYTTFTAPVTKVFSFALDYALGASAEISARADGVGLTPAGTDSGAGPFANAIMYFGRRAGVSLPYNGLDFGMVICGKTLTSNQISSTERYIAQRTGVTI